MTTQQSLALPLHQAPSASADPGDDQSELTATEQLTR